MSWLRNEHRTGSPIQVGERSLIPHTHVIQVDMPFVQGGYILNRPTSVTVREANGEEHRVTVPDVTRMVQIALIVMGLLWTIFLWRSNHD